MERKLAAIMAADVVGYSQMMGEDEAGTLGILKAFEKNVMDGLVSRHSGRIFKRMGDGYLTEFQSIVSAVECAIEWQESAEVGLNFRIGINLGDVIVEDDDVYGEGVNIASRIESLAVAGGICLSEDAWRQVRNKLAIEFEDLNEHNLKNIKDPVRVFQVSNLNLVAETVENASTSDECGHPYRGTTKIALAPFSSIDKSNEGQVLCSGLSATLITALSKFEEFALVDLTTLTEVTAGQATLDAARQLGIKFVLIGTVQMAGSQVRIGVTLVNTATGQSVWSETLNRKLEDVFELQDDITAYISSTMSDAVGEEKANAISGIPTDQLAAEDLMTRGIELLHNFDFEDNKLAMDIFERCRAIDPDALFPSLCLCWTYITELASGWPSSREDSIDFCLEEMKRLMHLYPRSAHIHRLISRIYYFQGDFAEGLVHAKRSFELNPFHSDMMITLGTAYMWDGRPKEALVLLERAFETNPYIPDVFRFYLALVYFFCDSPKEGIPILEAGEIRTPTAMVYQILLLIDSDQNTEALEKADQLKNLYPDFEPSKIQMFSSFRNEEDRDRIFNTLRKVDLVS